MYQKLIAERNATLEIMSFFNPPKEKEEILLLLIRKFGPPIAKIVEE